MPMHIVLTDGRHLITPNTFTGDLSDIVSIFNELSRDDSGPFVPIDLPGAGGMLIRLDEVIALYSEDEPDTITVALPAQVERALLVKRDEDGRISSLLKTCTQQ